MALALTIEDTAISCTALLVKGRLEDVFIEPPPELGPPAESIIRVRIDQCMSSTGGCFATLPGGVKGYVRHGSGLRAAEVGVVQVTGYRQAGKLVPLSDRIRLKGRYVILTPDRPGFNIARSIVDDDRRCALKSLLASYRPAGHEMPGVIMRSACADAGDDVIGDELDSLVEVMMGIDARRSASGMEVIRFGPNAAALAMREWAGVDEIKTDPAPQEIDHVVTGLRGCLAGPTALPGGGSLDIDETNALICIDVNTGSATARTTALTTAMQATREIPRQLRLRGLGGQIVIDYPSLGSQARDQIAQHIIASFGRDAVATRAIGWTRMGLFELVRKRERVPLARVMSP